MNTLACRSHSTLAFCRPHSHVAMSPWCLRIFPHASTSSAFFRLLPRQCCSFFFQEVPGYAPHLAMVSPESAQTTTVLCTSQSPLASATMPGNCWTCLVRDLTFQHRVIALNSKTTIYVTVLTFRNCHFLRLLRGFATQRVWTCPRAPTNIIEC